MPESNIQCDRIWTNLRLATADPSVKAPFGVLERQLLGVRDGRIALIASADAIDLEGFSGELIDGRGALMTPGLIDCHTHLVFGGHRGSDFRARLAGRTYEEIARDGGGILSTLRATRACDDAELLRQAAPRLESLIAEGVTCVEIKSGYGLTLEDELRMLRVARTLGLAYPVRVRTTLLAAHALPPEFRGRSEAYVDLVCNEIIPRAAAEQVADAVDVFCESIAFTPQQTERVFTSARRAGLAVKAHAEQLSCSGAAALAASFSAISADHLEYLDDQGAQALAASGTVAVLLPGAFSFLGQTRKPPVELLRRHGVALALGTDLNPGSSPFASLRLMMILGCTLFGLSSEEALAAVTRQGAAALGLADRLGTLAVGKEADMVLWDLEDPVQLLCQLGWGNPVQRIFKGEVRHA